MGAMLWGVQASASVAVNSCRLCNSLQQQQKQNRLNVVFSSSQICRQGALPGGSLTRVGFSESRNHPQVLYFSNQKQALKLRATASAEFHAVSSEEEAEYATEGFGVPDTISSSDAPSPPVTVPGSESVGLPSQFEDAPLLGQEGIQAPQSAGDVPALTPSDDLPGLPEQINPPPSPPAPAIDAFQSATEDGSAGEVLSIKEQYLRLTQGNRQSFEQSQTDDIGNAIQAAQDGINSARDAVQNSVQGLLNAVRDTVDSTGSTVKNAYDSANESFVSVVKSVTGNYDKSVDEAQGSTVDFTSAFRVGTPANDALREIVTSVNSATSSAVAGAGNLISQGYTTTKDNVPEDLKFFLDTVEGKLSQISGPVESAIDQAVGIITNAERTVGLDPNNPVIPVTLAVGGSLLLGFGYFNSRYGGYSGDLLPTAALDLLKNEKNVVLVDIRPQEAREAEGIPDLRRATRSKVAMVELAKVEGSIRSMVKNVSDVEVLLTAAVIRDLKNVERNSKIIVLDADGRKSKQIARGLRKSGLRRAYLVDGGFKAWASSGLRCKSGGPQSPLLILQEDAEAIVEEVKPTKFGILAVLLGFVAGTYAVIEWEKTLQFIGLLGVATSIYSRIESYESVEDAKADLRLLQKPFNVISQGIIWIAGIVEPKKLQLATSPVSSNVQGRVIQAAAKHGAVPELELVEDEPTTIPSTEEDDGADGEDDGADGGDDRVDGGDGSAQNQHTSLQEPQ